MVRDDVLATQLSLLNRVMEIIMMARARCRRDGTADTVFFGGIHAVVLSTSKICVFLDLFSRVSSILGTNFFPSRDSGTKSKRVGASIYVIIIRCNNDV